MTPIAWVVEHSLQASERFRHLTVLPDEDAFDVDFDAIRKEWSEHLDSWFSGKCNLVPIHEFLASRAISQMVKNFAERMK